MALPGDTTTPLTDEQRRLVEDNIALVPFVLTKYGTSGSSWDDAMGDGYCGLIRAAQKFDPTRARFSTYAVRWIRSGIQQGRLAAEGRNFRRAMGHGRGTDHATLYQAPLSLDAILTGTDGATLAEILPEPAQLAVDELADTDNGLLDRIRSAFWICRDDIDRDVLDAVAHGLPLAEIAVRYGLTRQAIDRRKHKLLGRLRSLHREAS